MKRSRSITQLSLSLAALFTCTTLSAHAAHRPQGTPDVIYGNDDRRDAFEITNPAWQAIAASTAALFRVNKVHFRGDYASLDTMPLGQRLQLCSEEPYYDQGSGAFCSGALVGPDLLLTAGHCVAARLDQGITAQDMCASTTVVFDFAVRDASGASPTAVPSSSVYRCKNVVQQVLDESTKNDFALIQLDRPVTDRAPLRVSRSPAIESGTPLVLIGHPSGIPMKIAGGAAVMNVDHPVYFTANTDSYGGNSGSSVFNATTGLIEGILVRGENDYVPDPEGRPCTVSNRCPDTGCSGSNGEEITRISMAVPFIPEIGSRTQ